MTQHWSTMKEAGALSGLRIMVIIYSILGRAVFNIVLAPVMLYFFLRRGDARRASLDYLRRVKICYPERFGNQCLYWLSYRHFVSFGRSLLDKYIARARKASDIVIDSEQEQNLLRMLSSGQGGLFIGSHFGNLEYARGLHDRHPEMVMNILMYDQHAENFSELTQSANPESRLTVFQVTDIDFELALVLKEKVERGEWVVIAGDRVPGCDRIWPVFADGHRVGQVTSAAWSPDFATNVAIGMVRMTHWAPGTRLEVETPAGLRDAMVAPGFWA